MRQKLKPHTSHGLKCLQSKDPISTKLNATAPPGFGPVKNARLSRVHTWVCKKHCCSSVLFLYLCKTHFCTFPGVHLLDPKEDYLLPSELNSQPLGHWLIDSYKSPSRWLLLSWIGDWIRGLVLTRIMLDHWATDPATLPPFLLSFETVFCFIAQDSCQHLILSPQPPE